MIWVHHNKVESNSTAFVTLTMNKLASYCTTTGNVPIYLLPDLAVIAHLKALQTSDTSRSIMKIPTLFFAALIACLLVVSVCANGGPSSLRAKALRFPGSRSIIDTNGGSSLVASAFAEEDGESKGSSASVQYMLTNKMKKTLINDLGYTLGEVDDMEPQIAAVVIEKSLSRPKNGMPVSWRRSSSVSHASTSGKRIKALIKQWKRLKSFCVKTASALKLQVVEQSQRPVVQGILVTVLLWLARQPIQNLAIASLDATRNAVQNFMLSEPSPPEAPPKPSLFGKPSLFTHQENRPNLVAPGSRFQSGTNKKAWWNVLSIFSRDRSSGRDSSHNGNKVDLQALGKVRKLSFLDSLRVRFDVFKMGI